MPTHIDDPVDRLRAASAAVKAARTNFEALPVDLIRPATQFLPSALFSVPEQLLAKAPDWVPGSVWNVVISNVRGPVHPVTTTGARMTGYWPAAFLTPGVGLNITLQSYVDRVDFGFMGCPDVTGDLWELPGYMHQELRLLLRAAGSVASDPAPSTPLRGTTGRRRGALRPADEPPTELPG